MAFGLCLGLSLAFDDPYQLGPHRVERHFVQKTNEDGMNHNVYLWAPDAEGEFPFIFFTTGFGGQLEELSNERH